MKKQGLILLATVLFVMRVLPSDAQKIYNFKDWQTSVSLTAGYNYSGLDYQIMLNNRISTSSFGFFAGFTYGMEDLKVGNWDYKEKATSYIGEAGGFYSFYNLLVPSPVNINGFLGIAYNVERMSFRDGSNLNNKTFGNVFGVSFEFFLSRAVSLYAKQSCYLLHSSKFGDFRTVSAAGLNFNF